MKQVRLYIAELLLNWAFTIMPSSEEKHMLAKLLLDYGNFVTDKLQEKK